LAEDPFLRSFSLIFEDIADSVRAPVVGFERHLDSGLAPTEFVRWMARWLGVNIDASLPENRQRSTLRSAGAMLQWRGTKKGLEGLLKSLVGGTVEVIEHGGVFREARVPHYDPRITVRIERSGGIDEQQLRRFIESELPLGTELELVVGVNPAHEQPDGERG
jgi:phage tail-like protein